ncbi:MFS transporter [Streptomyces sp. G45]|uniref:MFS transporter n=1 Tax=Streptomyces sp. G45 TaxID=3406627 RepID=UPI003C1B54DB
MPTSALRYRDFRLLWLGQTVSMAGSAASRVAVPLVAVTALNASSFTMGLLHAAAWVPWLAVGLPAGAWVDRLPRRPVLFWCNAFSAVLLLLTTAAAWWEFLTIQQLLLTALLTGVANVFFTTAYTAYVPTLLPAKALMDGNAKLQLSESTADLAAPGAAGLLVQAGGATLGFLSDGLSFLVSAALLRRIRAREGPPAGTGRRSLGREIREGIAFLRGNPFLRAVAWCDAGMNLFLSGTQALVVVFLSRTVGLTAGAIGLLFGLVCLGGVAGAALAPRLSRQLGSTPRAFLWCAVLGTPFGLLVPLTSGGAGLLAFVIGDFCLTASIAAGNVLAVSFRQTHCPADMLGRVSTSMRFLVYGTIPVGSLLGGALGTAWGDRGALWVLYGGATVCALLLLRAPIGRGSGSPGPTAPARSVPAP